MRRRACPLPGMLSTPLHQAAEGEDTHLSEIRMGGVGIGSFALN